MALQDLTPQLRTRLNRLERLVGLFVTVATLLMLGGLAYYIYQTAQRKGWFLIKAPYYTYVDSGAGIKVGDVVKMMGFDVGQITEITAMPPYNDMNANVFIAFQVREPYYGYLWNDSRARVASADFLGNRNIEVSKGTNGYPSYVFHELKTLTIQEALDLPQPNSWVFNEEIRDPETKALLAKVYAPIKDRAALERLAALGTNAIHAFDKSVTRSQITAIYNDQLGHYVDFKRESSGYFLPPNESPALTERLEKVAALVEHAIPNILDLTNQLHQVLTNVAGLASRADQLISGAQPALTNLNAITRQLTNANGSLGQWLIPTNIRAQIETSLTAADRTIQSADATLLTTRTNLNELSRGVLLTLENLADLTSNLNAQVQANAFILSDVSELVRNTDDMVQGLKRHWLLKGAFSGETNPVPESILKPTLGGPP
jgi:ABC-type transporter Mla subunit MlaD